MPPIGANLIEEDKNHESNEAEVQRRPDYN